MCYLLSLNFLTNTFPQRPFQVFRFYSHIGCNLQGELDVRVWLQPCTFRLLGGELFDIWKQSTSRGRDPRDQALVFRVTWARLPPLHSIAQLAFVGCPFLLPFIVVFLPIFFVGVKWAQLPSFTQISPNVAPWSSFPLTLNPIPLYSVRNTKIVLKRPHLPWNADKQNAALLVATKNQVTNCYETFDSTLKRGRWCF